MLGLSHVSFVSGFFFQALGESPFTKKAMGQHPNLTPSEHPNPTTKIGSKMGGEFTYQPKWDPKTVLTTGKSRCSEKPNQCFRRNPILPATGSGAAHPLEAPSSAAGSACAVEFGARLRGPGPVDPVESQSKPIGTKMVIPEPCTGIRRRISAALFYGWDRPLLTFIYPGFDCGSVEYMGAGRRTGTQNGLFVFCPGKIRFMDVFVFKLMGVGQKKVPQERWKQGLNLGRWSGGLMLSRPHMLIRGPLADTIWRIHVHQPLARLYLHKGNRLFKSTRKVACLLQG